MFREFPQVINLMKYCQVFFSAFPALLKISDIPDKHSRWKVMSRNSAGYTRKCTYQHQVNIKSNDIIHTGTQWKPPCPLHCFLQQTVHPPSCPGTCYVKADGEPGSSQLYLHWIIISLLPLPTLVSLPKKESHSTSLQTTEPIVPVVCLHLSPPQSLIPLRPLGVTRRRGI